jgi:hypothetical protein
MARRPARVCPATYSTLYIFTRFRIGLIALDQYLLENVYYAIVGGKPMRGVLMFCAGVLLASAATLLTGINCRFNLRVSGASKAMTMTKGKRTDLSLVFLLTRAVMGG